jgi:hypothetical protein
MDWLSESKRDTLARVAGITGFGWAASLLGFLSTVVGYGNSLVTRVADPQSLLYLGGVLFVATFGLDRLAERSDEDG